MSGKVFQIQTMAVGKKIRAGGPTLTVLFSELAMNSYRIMRFMVIAALCGFVPMTNETAAQSPQLGIHEVSVQGLPGQDGSGSLVEAGVRMDLGCGVRFDDETWRLMKQHDKVIKEFAMNTPFLTDDVIRWLATQEKLQSVNLTPNFFVDSAARDFPWNLMPLESLQHLEQLTLSDMRITDESWLAIGRMRALKSLSLLRCRIDSQGSLPLVNLRNLKYLVVESSNVDDRFLAGLSNLTHLQRLQLMKASDGEFTSEGLKSLAATNLKELHLSQEDFGNDWIEAVNGISSLQIVTGVSDSEAAQFTKHPNLLRFNNRTRLAADGSPFVDPNAPGERTWVLQPSELGENKLSTTAQPHLPIQPDRKSLMLKSIPLTIEVSGDTAGERVKEFEGRQDVLKSSLSDKADAKDFMTLEVPLPDDKEIIAQRPNQIIYLSLSVWPPTRGKARLIIYEKERSQASWFLVDLNQLDSVQPPQREMIEQKDGWMVLRIPLILLESNTKRLAMKLIVGANSPAVAYWANPVLEVGADVTYEELDPTKKTIFQSYLDRDAYPYARLLDAATGNVLKEGIGIGWARSKMSCLFARDGSHVAVISRYHDNYRSGSSHYEHLWLFALRPFRLLQEAKSSGFNNIRFSEDNKALLFEFGGPPKISGL